MSKKKEMNKVTVSQKKKERNEKVIWFHIKPRKRKTNKRTKKKKQL